MDFNTVRSAATQATTTATAVAGSLAERIGPTAEVAGTYATKGVRFAAESANKATGDRFETPINTAAGVLGGFVAAAQQAVTKQAAPKQPPAAQ